MSHYKNVGDTLQFSLVNSFMMEVPIIQKPVHWFANQWTGFYVIGTFIMKELKVDARVKDWYMSTES